MSRLTALPNVLTLSRLAAAPVLVFLAAGGSETLFVAGLAGALATDIIDGPIARALGKTSDLGATLDSYADVALYVAAPVGTALLNPWLLSQHAPLMGAILIAWLVPIAVGAARFGRLTSYHTIAARLSGSALAVAGFSFLLTDAVWPLRVAMVMLLVSASEEIAITCVLPRWRANVPSLRAAWMMRGTTAAGGSSVQDPEEVA